MSSLASFTLIFLAILPSSLALGADASDGFLDCLQKTSDFSEMSDKELLRALRGVRGFTTEEEFIALEARRKTLKNLSETTSKEDRDYRAPEIKAYGESLLEILKLTRVAYRLNDRDPSRIVVEILPVPLSKSDPEKFVHPLNRFAWGIANTQKATVAIDLNPNQKINGQYVAAFSQTREMILVSDDLITHLGPTLNEGHEIIHARTHRTERDLIALGELPSNPRMVVRVQDAGDDGYHYAQNFPNDEAAAYSYTLSVLSADLANRINPKREKKTPQPVDAENEVILGIDISGLVKRRLERSEDQIQAALSQIPKLDVPQLLEQRLKANPDGTCTYLVQTAKNATRSLTFFPSKTLEKALDAIEMLPDSELRNKNPLHRPSAQAEAVRLEVVRALSEELKTELAAVQKARASHQAAFTLFQQRRIGDEYRIDQTLIDAFRKPYQEYNELQRKDQERVKVGK